MNKQSTLLELCHKNSRLFDISDAMTAYDFDQNPNAYEYGTRTWSSLYLQMIYYLTVLGHQQTRYWPTHGMFLLRFTDYQWLLLTLRIQWRHPKWPMRSREILQHFDTNVVRPHLEAHIWKWMNLVRPTNGHGNYLHLCCSTASKETWHAASSLCYAMLWVDNI